MTTPATMIPAIPAINMNVYASVEDYRELFETELCDDELQKQLGLASLKADELTFGRIKPEKLTGFQRECLKNFVCHQADYMAENGFDSDGVTSYSTGSISVSVNRSATEAGRLGVSPAGLSYLKLTGLMSRVM